MDAAVCADPAQLTTRGGRIAEVLPAKCGRLACPGYGWRMEDKERDAAVQDHLKALDDELARLRKLEAAMDRRIEEAEAERSAIEDEARRRSEGE